MILTQRHLGLFSPDVVIITHFLIAGGTGAAHLVAVAHLIVAYRLRRIWRQKCSLFCCRWAVCGGSGYGCRPLNCDISGRSDRPARPDRPAASRGAGHVLPGGGRPRRRGMPLPYKPSGDDRSSGKARTPRTTVGRDALIPPDPAAARTSRF